VGRHDEDCVAHQLRDLEGNCEHYVRA
jgi:hypothetical protein